MEWAGSGPTRGPVWIVSRSHSDAYPDRTMTTPDIVASDDSTAIEDGGTVPNRSGSVRGETTECVEMAAGSDERQGFQVVASTVVRRKL